MNKELLIRSPKHTLIEQVALNFAAVFYDACRTSGMKSEKHNNPRSWAKANFVKFIPKAIEHLTEMLGNPHINDLMKQEIYEAIMERTNDPRVEMAFNNRLPDLDIDKLLDTKPLPPIIVNSISVEKALDIPSVKSSLNASDTIKPLQRGNNPYKKVN